MTLKLLIKSQFDIEVDSACNGKEAVDKFKQKIDNYSKLDKVCERESYRLIFMDLNMPIMDGFDASEIILKMQSEKQAPKCEIIALSAFVNQPYIERCMNIGMAQFMNKPAQSKDIKELIRKYCPFLSAEKSSMSRLKSPKKTTDKDIQIRKKRRHS